MKLLKILDGNKTILFLSILGVLNDPQYSVIVADLISETGLKIALLVLKILAVAAGIHHAQKGYLGTKKGN